MSFVNNLRSLFGGVVIDDASLETIEEQRFRLMIRELNTPKILPPEEYIDKYSPAWAERRNPNERSGQ